MRESKAIRVVALLWMLSLITLGGMSLRPEVVVGQNQNESPKSVLVQSDRPLGRHLFDDWYTLKVTAQTESEAVLRVMVMTSLE